MAKRRPSSLKRWTSSTVVTETTSWSLLLGSQRLFDLARFLGFQAGLEGQVERGQPELTIKLDLRLEAGIVQRLQMPFDGARFTAPDGPDQGAFQAQVGEVAGDARQQRDHGFQRLTAVPSRRFQDAGGDVAERDHVVGGEHRRSVVERALLIGDPAGAAADLLG